MLPGSNRGVGQNLCFPDVCLTPTPVGPMPLPYPNLAFNMMANGFSLIVKISMMNALNLMSKIPMTTGDEGGVAHPTVKGMGGWMMGHPIVFIDKLPAICLCSLATGNMMNAPLGAAIVASLVNVFYTRTPDGSPEQPGPDPFHRPATLEEARRFSVEDGLCVERTGSLLILRFASIGPATPGRVFVELERTGFDPGTSVVLDLRRCPGGELGSFLRLAEMFLPNGAILARVIDEDGDETVHRGRGGEALHMPLSVWVDGHTASAAELLAGVLQLHGRALVAGERTYGKSLAQVVRVSPQGAADWVSALRVLLPDGSDIEGCGVVPERAIG